MSQNGLAPRTHVQPPCINTVAHDIKDEHPLYLYTPKSPEEAECLLDLAHAKCDSQWAAKHLADTHLKESRLRTKLHILQAKQATRTWGDAELDVGCMSLAIEQSGYFILPSPSQALQKYGPHDNASDAADGLVAHLD